MKTHSASDCSTRRAVITLSKSALSAAFAALAFAAGLTAPLAHADDTEVFFTPVGNAAAPNILFILDSSESMSTLLPPAPGSGSDTDSKPEWDPAEDWLVHPDITATGCQSNRLYWLKTPVSPDEFPKDCSGLNYIEVNLASPNDASNKFVCKAAIDTLSNPGTTGYVLQSDVAQFNPTTSGPQSGRQVWIPLEQSLSTSRVTECRADNTVHGLNDSSTNRSPRNKTTDGFGNSTTAADHTTAMLAFTTSAYFYTANFIAWNSIPSTGSTTQITRMEALKGALKSMILSVNGVNVGLMRFANVGNASSGGMVVHDMTSIESGRDDILYTLYDRLECSPSPGKEDYCRKIFVPGGTKAIGETLFEAINYFAGCIDKDGDGTAESCPPKTLPQSQTATGSVVWGDQSKIDPDIPFESVPPSIANFADAPGNWMYRSPASECGKNFIVLLTDGLTEQDRSNDTAVSKLPNFLDTPGIDKAAGTCDSEPVKSGSTPSECVDDLPGYMWENDVNSILPGVQNVKTYTVGFDLGTSTLGEAARQVLKDAARRGGGDYFDATDEASLTIALTEIARQILLDNGSFTAPSIAVNAFNRTQNLNDLYMSVFKPSLSYRWLGNVKKYRLDPSGEIVDANGDPAVDPATGFFATETQSFWSDVEDGPDASLGGAAGELKVPASRTIYTNIEVSAGAPAVVDSGTLSTALSALKATDTATVEFANKILFDIEAPAAVPTSYPAMADLIDWAYGVDVQDQVGASGTTTDARLDMGDPLHARPATVIYGGPASAPDTTIFATTNDGMLHAINAATGAELWAFAPVQLLPRLLDLYQDDGVASRVYGLDGSVKFHKIDNNQNGIVETSDGDQVLIFFGMRRGGSHYYALDVTNRSSPKLLWRIGAEDDPAKGVGTITSSSPRHLPGIGQAWSVPTITRMNIDRDWGSSNPKKLVAVFGGGYDPEHDEKIDSPTYSDDAVGNRVYIVDAITGELIWHAGPDTDSSANLQLSNMVSSITAEVRSFDLTGDGFDDRMYTSDLGGRVWRFDIVNGAVPNDLVKGGLFATLGVGDSGGTPDTANRKFFYAPDASLIRSGGRSWINIAIGSGDRERPVSEGTQSGIPVVQNRFFSLRDYAIFTSIASDKYLDDCSSVTTEPCHQIITASDSRLTDVTTDLNPTLATNSAGWYMNLTETGEKALAESRTFQNAVYFTTYVPRERNVTVECGLAVGVSKLYVVSAVNANPIFNYDVTTDGATSLSDRSKDLAQGAIAPEVTFVFPSPASILRPPRDCSTTTGCDPNDPRTWPVPPSCASTPGCIPSDPSTWPLSPGPAVPPVCLVGLETCGGGITNPPVRTYWRQRGSN